MGLHRGESSVVFTARFLRLNMPAADFSHSLGGRLPDPSVNLPRTRRSRTIWEISRGTPGYFQRTIVRYTEFNHVKDIGLYPVLRTRPSLPPPQICLPSTFWYGAYLYVDPRFCRRLPSDVTSLQHPCFRLPFASFRLGLDVTGHMCHISGITI